MLLLSVDHPNLDQSVSLTMRPLHRKTPTDGIAHALALIHKVHYSTPLGSIHTVQTV